MKNKTTKQGCAGNCAGKSSNNGLKTPKFQRVKNSKVKPIRGVWIRRKQFYARLFIDNGSGQKIDRRVPLEAKTVQDARRELEQLNVVDEKPIKDLLRKHGGKTNKELKAEGKLE